MTKKNNLGADAIKISASKIISLGMTMVTTMLLSRFRTLEEYGTYSQMLLVIGLVTSVCMLGLPNCINYFLARAETREDKSRFLSVYYTLNTVLSIIIGFFLVCAIPLFEVYFSNPLIKSFAFFMAIYPWTRITLSGVENLLVVYKKIKLMMIIRIADSAAVLLAVSLAVVTGISFRTYIFVYCLVEVFFALIVYIIVVKLAGSFKVSFDKKYIAKIFKFSVPIGLAASIGTINIELDKFMIGRFFGTENLAIYTNAAKILPVTVIMSSLTAVVFPQIVKRVKNSDKPGAVELWKKSSQFSFIFLSMFAGIFFVFAEDIISVLYSEKYLPGVWVFRIFNGTIMLEFTYFGMILNSFGKTKFILYSSMLSLCMNLVLNFVLMKIMGIEGAAISSVASTTVIAFVQLLFSAKLLNKKVTEIMPWLEFLKCLCITLVFVSVNMFLKKSITLEKYVGEVTESVILSCFWCITYILLYLKELKGLWHSLKYD